MRRGPGAASALRETGTRPGAELNPNLQRGARRGEPVYTATISARFLAHATPTSARVVKLSTIRRRRARGGASRARIRNAHMRPCHYVKDAARLRAWAQRGGGEEVESGIEMLGRCWRAPAHRATWCCPPRWRARGHGGGGGRCSTAPSAPSLDHAESGVARRTAPESYVASAQAAAARAGGERRRPEGGLALACSATDVQRTVDPPRPGARDSIRRRLEAAGQRRGALTAEATEIDPAQRNAG